MILSQIVHRFSRFSHRPQGTCLGTSQRFRKLEAAGATFGAFNVTAGKAWHERQQRQDLGRIERSEVQFLGLSWFQVLDMTPPEAERNDNITISGSEIGSFGCFWRFGVSPVSTQTLLEYIMRCFARLVSDPDSVEGIEQN